MRNIRRFVLNALVLTGASLLMRTVGVSFNAYISNKIGASGMGLYSLIMSVYIFAVTFATSGISLASTRLVAEALGRGDKAEAKAAMRRCIIYSLCFGTVGCVLLYTFSSYIGTHLLGDARTVPSLRLLAMSLPPIGLTSALGGYFTAVRRVFKNAATQLFEQAVKIFLCVYGLIILLPYGIEYACIALVGGGALAELLSFFFMYIQYIVDKRKHLKGKSGNFSRKGLTRSMLGISLPVAFSAYIRSGLVTIEHMLIPFCLTKNGGSRDSALASYGILHGMVMPVVLYPSAISGAFAGLLVPELAECRAQGNETRTRYIVSRVLQLTMIFSVGTAGILISFSHELGNAIYNNREAGEMIRIMAPLVPVMFLDISTDSMLKGLGQQVYSMGVNIVDALLSVIFVYLLLPVYGIMGYVIVIFITEIVNATLSIYRLLEVTSFRPKIWSWLLKPLICIIFANGAVQLIARAFGGARADVLDLVVRIALTSLIYIVLLFLFGCFSKKDAVWMRSIITGK